MSMSEDLTPFFNTDEFADEFACAAKGFEFTGIFNDGFYDSNGIETTRPSAICDSSEITELAHDDEVEHDDVCYVVRAIEPDGTGVSVVYFDEV